MISNLKQFYRRQAFFPNWLGVFINPFFLARRGLAASMREYAPRLEGKLLDIGCGTKPYKALFHVDEYIGLDIDSETSRKRGVADHLYDGNIFPFSNQEFESVLCNQVLEHVFNPDFFLREIHRVLKPDGKLLLTVPFVWDEHEQPYDYARYSSFGLRALLDKNGFEILVHKKICPDASILFQMFNAYLYKVIQNWPLSARLAFTATVMASINILGVIAKRLLPGNPDLFLDQIVLAEKKG